MVFNDIQLTSTLNTLPYLLFFVSYFLLIIFHRRVAEIAEFSQRNKLCVASAGLFLSGKEILFLKSNLKLILSRHLCAFGDNTNSAE